jgi:MFS family permease
LWVCASVLTSLGLMALAFIHSVLASLPVFFAIGVGTLAFLGATNTLIQTLAPDAVRGRAIAVYTMVAIGVVPAGSLVLGAIASVIGLHLAFALGGAICLICAVTAYALNPVIRTV